jgi:hypothetical protein
MRGEHAAHVLDHLACLVANVAAHHPAALGPRQLAGQVKEFTRSTRGA